MDVILIANIIGGIGAVVSCLALASKSDVVVKAGLFFRCLSFTIYFFLFGSYSASACQIVNGARMALSIKQKYKNSAYVFFIFYLIIGYATFDGFIHLAPVFCSVLGTYAVFFLTGPTMRIVMIASTCIWIGYAAHTGLYVVLGMEILGLCFSSVGLWRVLNMNEQLAKITHQFYPRPSKLIRGSTQT
jgi:hypothetical protein